MNLSKFTCTLFALFLFPLISSAALNFEVGDGFYFPGVNDDRFLTDPQAGTLVSQGSAVYLIFDTDGDGSAGDVDPDTGMPINGDLLVAQIDSFTVGQGLGLDGGFSSSAAFADLNAALDVAGVDSGLFYVRVFNVPNPATAPMGRYAYGDSIDPLLAGNTAVADEDYQSFEATGYFRYTRTVPDSPRQFFWIAPVIELQIVNPEPEPDPNRPTVEASFKRYLSFVQIRWSVQGDMDALMYRFFRSEGLDGEKQSLSRQFFWAWDEDGYFAYDRLPTPDTVYWVQRIGENLEEEFLDPIFPPTVESRLIGSLQFVQPFVVPFSFNAESDRVLIYTLPAGVELQVAGGVDINLFEAGGTRAAYLLDVSPGDAIAGQ